jgi:hypothetical protein
MAGNTKLLGFGAGFVTLQRWGGEANVDLPSGSIDALKKACHEELPSAPEDTSRFSHLSGVKYEPDYGLVRMTMTPTQAALIQDALKERADEADSNEREELLVWAEELQDKIKEHEDYINPKGEPGVDDSH